MGLTDFLTGKMRDKRKGLAKRYMDIVSSLKGKEDIPDNLMDELNGIMTTFSIGLDQLDRDVKNWCRHDDDSTVAKLLDEREKHNNKLAKDYNDYIEESRKIELARQLKATELKAIQVKAQSKVRESWDAHESMDKISRDYPYLFTPDVLVDILDGKHPTIKGYDGDGNLLYHIKKIDFSGNSVLSS